LKRKSKMRLHIKTTKHEEILKRKQKIVIK
jgi:hypothetical protein